MAASGGFFAVTSNQEKLIALLLEGKKLKEAAIELGIGERTAQRWHKDTEFQRAFEQERQRQLSASIIALQLKFDGAVETLGNHTKAETTNARDQIKAAEVIIDKTLQTADQLRRIAELEAELEAQQQDQMYQVTFDLRKLTREERATLEAINTRLEGTSEKS